MTEDNKFEAFIKKTAQGYNSPPVRTPREEMWSAIQARRAGPRVVYGGATMRAPGERRFGSRVWLGAAAAALLLVATGVGIGRWSAKPGTPRRVAVVAPGVNPTSGTSVGASDSQVGGAPEETSNASRGRVSGVPRRAPDDRRPDVGPDRVTRKTEGVAEVAGSSAYQIAAARHLSDAEALLTSFRSRSAADQQMDAQLGTWARELLSNTRLLLDSPVANDPHRRPLLEDLELVLVQIVQLSPGSTAQDRELIEKTLQQDHVLSRLRTAIPAGPPRGS
ncbi:MAG: hypothetical protein ABR585_12440 [Gemmatimonadaceae bacterium]